MTKRPAATNSPVWLRLARDTALIRQNGRCKYCLRRLARVEATADHIIPRAEHGTDDPKNIVAACGWCNRGKGKKPYADFLAMVKGERRPSNFSVQLSASLRTIAERGDAAESNILRLVGVKRRNIRGAA